MSMPITKESLAPSDYTYLGIDIHFVDPCAGDMVSLGALEMLKTVIDNYKLRPSIDLFITHHGHIAVLQVPKPRFVQHKTNNPFRLDAKDARFFMNLRALRWFEFSVNYLKVAFDDSDFKELN